jgi:hypothetical protein
MEQYTDIKRQQMEGDIKRQLEIIESSLAWADQFGKESFNRGELKGYRRAVKKIKFALAENCSAAAYGESQVGKSYLMDSLLGDPNRPFEIVNNGQSYSFINQINSSGGNNSKIETTGVITRFTLKCANPVMREYVRIRTLTVLDLILLITDSYYKDVIRSDHELSTEDINNQLVAQLPYWVDRSYSQTFITEDDIMDIKEYIDNQRIADFARVSKFFDKVAPVIQYVKPEKWGDVFALLWNNNPNLTRLFQHLVAEYQKIGFLEEVYVPFAAVLREKGTLLKIEWLNLACGMEENVGNDITTTDVLDGTQHVIARDYSKASLSALIAELTFTISVENVNEKLFLQKIDLLDFPGARSREELKEEKMSEPAVLARMLRRGKVAYLFQKYSHALRINSLLFCHHNDQKTVKELGTSISDWIDSYIGDNEQKRTERLRGLQGVSPFFLVATKFNIDLRRNRETDTPTTQEKLKEHWKRFDTILPEIIKPYTWFDEWADGKPFSGIYPLRDFYWSKETGIFEGYSNKPPFSEETGVKKDPDYPDYFENLRRSFIEFPCMQQHFPNPGQIWDEVATPNNDGSKAIIRDLNRLAPQLDEFRTRNYLEELIGIRNIILKILAMYYISDSDEEKNAQIKKITSDIRRKIDMSVFRKPEIFGTILDKLMVLPGDLREIAYDIIIRQTEVPKDFSNVSGIRAIVGINPHDSRDGNIAKLCDYYGCTPEELDADFRTEGFTLEDVVSGDSETLATVADVLTKKIIEYWTAYINKSVKNIDQYLTHADEIVESLQTLLRLLGVKREITSKITAYQQIFPKEDLPNAVAAVVSLILNNFVSSFGRKYMTEENIDAIKTKAGICNINVDLSDKGLQFTPKPQSIEDVLNTLTASEQIAREGTGSPSTRETLRKLPLYDNFMRWENFLIIGMLLSSDVSTVDPVANGSIKTIIDNCKGLYNSASL